MELYKAALVATFGGHSQRPYRAARLRIGILGALALACGFALSRLVGQLPLGATHHSHLFIPGIVFVMQLVVLCALLAASGVTQRIYTDSFARWLLLLPITTLTRWLVLMTPSILLAGLALLVASRPLGQLWLQLGIPPLFILGGSLVGVMCGLGLFYALPPRVSALRVILIPYVIWYEYKLVSIASADTHSSMAAVCAFTAIVCILATIWVWSSRYTYKAIAHTSTGKRVFGSSVSPRWWYSKKLVRSPSIRLSHVTAVGLTLALVAADKAYELGTATLTVSVAIVIAAFASDIRALTRRILPAEIAGLKGCWYFMSVHASGAVVGSILIATPLLIHLDGLTAAIVCPLLTGISTGLFAGNVLTPSSRDISGQFLSGLLCIGILLLLPNLPGLHVKEAIQPLLYASIAIVLFIASYWIEYKRNPYTWRNSHA